MNLTKYKKDKAFKAWLQQYWINLDLLYPGSSSSTRLSFLDLEETYRAFKRGRPRLVENTLKERLGLALEGMM